MGKHGLFILIVGFLFCFAILNAQLLGQSDEDKAAKVIQETAKTLGWPEDYSSEGGFGSPKMFAIGPNGAEKDQKLFAKIIVFGNEKDSAGGIDVLEQNGLLRASYNGRDAVISYKGDQICPKPGSTVWFVMEGIKKIASAIFPDQVDTSVQCFEQSYGSMGWRCGNYLFAVQDQTGSGAEKEIAAALYARTEVENLCGLGDTIVILADTSDKSGANPLLTYQDIAQRVNSYYGQNGYGRVQFTYTFKDADGSLGNKDWYRLPNSMNSYADETDYAIAATKEAFKGSDLPDKVYVERIIVVYPGKGKQEDPTAKFSTLDSWKKDDFYIEVGGLLKTSRIYAPNLIVVSENDELGTWAHEIGHSLYCKYKTDGVWNRLNDRYNYAGNPSWQYGFVGDWDLMGSGNWKGAPSATTPTQMSGYTKEAANWLTYQTVRLNASYTDTAIENKKMSDFVYQLDDPESADPLYYYVIEARDSGASYGAPESGVVMYRVWYDHANTHEVVNVLRPQSGTTVDTASDGKQYIRPTLNSVSGNGSEYINIPGKFKVSLQTESNSPYTSGFTVESYVPPVKMKGAKAVPKGAPAVAAPAGADPAKKVNSKSGYMPDLDLHAYDDQGRHVGLNYDTWEYENQIPGAISSGDLKDDYEWIFVPYGANVRFELSGEKTALFLKDNPEFAKYASPKEASLEYFTISPDGAMEMASGGDVRVDYQAPLKIKSPDDSSLSYSPKNDPGFNNNSSGGCLPGFVLLAILGLAAFMRRDGK